MDARDRCRQLRGAVYRGGGQAVVDLAPMLTPDDVLQLLGDGLLHALAQHAEGAAELAAKLVEDLRGRFWDGDDELADQLEAALGRRPALALAPLTIDLEELALILEGNPGENEGRIDLTTGVVWIEAVLENSIDSGLFDPDDAEDPDRWLVVFGQGSRDGYQDMEIFIDTLTDPDQVARLEKAITGSGAFRRFRDTIRRWPDELDRWYAFTEDRQRGRARAWLADAGYRPAVRATPGSPPEP